MMNICRQLPLPAILLGLLVAAVASRSWGPGSALAAANATAPAQSDVAYAVDIEQASNATEPAAPPTAEELGLRVDKPFDAQAVLDAQTRLPRLLRESGRPFAEVYDRKVFANFPDKSVKVVYFLDPGPAAVFGPARFEGLETVDEAFLRRETPWDEGQPYDSRLLRKYEGWLGKLDLFSTIHVTPVAPVADGKVAILADLTESRHRTVKGGVGYRTDDGPGAMLGWEHRNLLGHGETLSAKLQGSQIEKSAELTYEIPLFLRKDQSLIASVKADDSDKKAYKGQSGKASVGVKHKFTDELSAQIGLAARYSKIERDEAKPWENAKTFRLVSLPLEAAWDDRDDPVSPSSGGLYTLTGAPYLSVAARTCASAS